MTVVLPVWCLWLLLGCQQTAPQAPREPAPPRSAPAVQPDILFFVMDTVRADRLSVCGHDRPTSPALAALVQDGAALTCQGYAPGDWTLPSHASYFTGQPVHQHRAHALDDRRAGSAAFQGLADSAVTIAETLVARGYQTLAVAENPLILRGAGLDQGIQTKQIAFFGSEGAPYYVDHLLRRTAPEKPLYLFVNLFDAHRPFQSVPEGLSWLPAHPGTLDYQFSEGCPPADPWRRFTRGEMPDTESAAFLAQLHDRYDHGVWKEDQKLGQILAHHRQARPGRPLRIVITSDHGELLGEHGHLGHGTETWEENQRVPLLFASTSEDNVTFPDAPISALSVYSLVLDGVLPSPMPEVAAVAYPSPVRESCSAGVMGTVRSLSLWKPAHKTTLRGEDWFQFDLEHDPKEQRPRPAQEPEIAQIKALDAQAARSWEERATMSASLKDILQELGYIE